MAWERVIKQGNLPIVDGANSYVDESDFDAYAAQIGFDLTNYDESKQQTAVIVAAQYINSLSYSGNTYAPGVVMQFPRSGMDSVPEVVRVAQLWLSVKLLENPQTPLYEDTTNGKLRRKTIGPISKEWFSPDELGQSGIQFDYINNMLSAYLSSDGKIWIGNVE